MRRFLGFAFLIGCCASSLCQEPTTTYLIVRHAERLTPEADALSPQGDARAQELAHVAAKANVAAIYHSDKERTRQTAAPTAAALKLTPVAIPAKDIKALIDHIEKNHRGQTVLIVGHSNTVPMIIREAGGPPLPDIDDKEFDNLFVLTRDGCGEVRLVQLQYGAASP